MSTLRNPVWIGFNGEPITGRTPPRMQVYGPALSKAQMGEVAHAYHQFCTANSLALGQYQSRERKLADGTRVRMVSINGVDTVQVWPTGGEEVACETLFYGRPASADHVNGYTPPEMSGTTTIWPEYNQKKAPPDTLKYIDSTQLYGESTWYSSKIKLNVEGYSPVMPAVVSWRGRGYRYGAYGQTQPNYNPFIEPTRPQRVPSVFPGQAYGSSHNGAASSTVWINDTQFDAWANVFGAGLRKIENEGVFLYVAETPTLFQLKVYRMPIKLPLRKGNGGSLGPGELVATFDFDYFDPYQGPFFNESCTKMAMLAIVERDGEDQTCIVECDIDAQTYAIVHAATNVFTTPEYTSTLNWTATVNDFTPEGGSPTRQYISQTGSSSTTITAGEKSVTEYAIAVDYLRDERVHVLARVSWESTANTPGDGTVSYSHTYSPAAYSGTKEQTFADSLKLEVIHSTHGMVYSKTYASEGHDTQSLTMNGVPPQPELTASGSRSYAWLTPPTIYFDFSKIQTVGGDLRHDLLILADSSYHDAWRNEFDYAGSLVVTDGAVYGASSAEIQGEPEYRIDRSSTPVRYVVLKDGAIAYESEETLYTVDYPVPRIYEEQPDGSAIVHEVTIGDFHMIGGYGTPTSGSSTTNVTPTTYTSPYVAPVSQPTFFPTQASGDLYNAIVAANGNNQPGACCAIAWSPTFPGDPKPEVGYVSFISPRLWDADGNEVPRVEFTKWYIGGQWVDSPIYAPGEQQTIVRPIFMGTQLK